MLIHQIDRASTLHASAVSDLHEARKDTLHYQKLLSDANDQLGACMEENGKLKSKTASLSETNSQLLLKTDAQSEKCENLEREVASLRETTQRKQLALDETSETLRQVRS